MSTCSSMAIHVCFEFICCVLNFSNDLCIPLLPHDLYLFFMRLKHLQLHRIDNSFDLCLPLKELVISISSCLFQHDVSDCSKAGKKWVLELATSLGNRPKSSELDLTDERKSKARSKFTCIDAPCFELSMLLMMSGSWWTHRWLNCC